MSKGFERILDVRNNDAGDSDSESDIDSSYLSVILLKHFTSSAYLLDQCWMHHGMRKVNSQFSMK